MKKISLYTIIALFSAMQMIYAQEGLVAHWSFDHVSGDTIYDQSVYGNHGTNYGAEIIAGAHGNALFFNGQDDYARIPGNGQNPPAILSGLGSGSISVWFNIVSIPTDYGIAPIFYYGSEEACDFFDAANQGLIIEIGHSPIHYGSERLYFTIWKNGCTLPSFCYDSNDPITTNTWHHFVAVVGENYNTGYLDGVEMTNRRYNFGNSQYSQFFEDAVVHEKLWIGKGHWDRTTQYFHGAIDDIRIYDRALSGAEIMNLYNLTRVDENLQPSKEMKIYPNPSAQILYYELPGTSTVESVMIRDISGKLVKHYLEAGNNNTLETGSLPEGLYLLDIIADQNTYRQKFMVRR